MTGIQKKQRLLTMIFGAFAIFFTGYPHVWSIYQPYVMEQAGWSQGQASMCFYLALSTFVFGNIVGGRMQNRFKEKTIVWIGGGIFAAGILASAFLIVPTPLPMYTASSPMFRTLPQSHLRSPDSYRICFRCCGNCQRTLRIFPGAAESKAAGGRGRAENLSDHWGSQEKSAKSVGSYHNTGSKSGTVREPSLHSCQDHRVDHSLSKSLHHAIGQIHRKDAEPL